MTCIVSAIIMILLVNAADAMNPGNRRFRTIKCLDERGATSALTSLMKHDTSADDEAPPTSERCRQTNGRVDTGAVLTPEAGQVGNRKLIVLGSAGHASLRDAAQGNDSD